MGGIGLLNLLFRLSSLALPSNSPSSTEFSRRISGLDLSEFFLSNSARIDLRKPEEPIFAIGSRSKKSPDFQET